MADFAAGFGITGMAFPRKLPNTRRALALAEYARDKGKLEAFRVLGMKARWQEDRDLEDDSVLRDLAQTTGLDPHKALAAADSAEYRGRVELMGLSAQKAGINAIPAFIIGKTVVVGCQPYCVLKEAVLKEGGSSKRSSVDS